MNITFAVVGKTFDDYLKTGENIYLKRLKKYVKIEMIEVPQVKKPGGYKPSEQKKHEAKYLKKHIQKSDYIILLDESGEQYKSEQFAKKLQTLMNLGTKNLLFIAGGPYGFDDEIINKANTKLSLSRMTFSHQMLRLIFLEQLYRAFTIIKGEPYHNK